MSSVNLTIILANIILLIVIIAFAFVVFCFLFIIFRSVSEELKAKAEFNSERKTEIDKLSFEMKRINKNIVVVHTGSYEDPGRYEFYLDGKYIYAIDYSFSEERLAGAMYHVEKSARLF